MNWYVASVHKAALTARNLTHIHAINTMHRKLNLLNYLISKIFHSVLFYINTTVMEASNMSTLRRKQENLCKNAMDVWPHKMQ